MPRRKRAQEFKRRLRKVVERVEVEIEREERQARLLAFDVDPLGDTFWDEHENPDNYLCSCYSDQTTAAILAAAQEEINEYLNRGGS